MSAFLRVCATALNCLFLIAAERLVFRADYKYEKTFNAFYKLHQTAMSWAEARIRCQAEGAQLLVPDFLDEADTVPLLMTTILGEFESIFVGIHDLYSERSFVTIKGGVMMVSFLNLLWEYREPKHGGGRCVAMRRTGRLFVHPCDKSLPFMCKVSADDVQFQTECNTYNPDWVLGNDNYTCYFMHVEPQSWYQAHATCLAAGGDLAVVDDGAEAEYIKSMFKQTTSKRIPNNDFAFLGFNDLFMPHHYRTVHGDRIENLKYKDWQQQACTKFAMNITGFEFRCGGIRRTGLLSTWNCNIPAMFFCEKLANKTMMMKSVLREGDARTMNNPRIGTQLETYEEIGLNFN